MDVTNNLNKVWYSNFLEKYHPKQNVCRDTITCEKVNKNGRFEDKVTISNGKHSEDNSASLIDEYLALKSSHRRRLVRRFAET